MSIESHESWSIHDSTKIQCFLDCRRKYFFEHVLGWRKQGINVHLAFGDALHLGLDHLESNRPYWPDPSLRAVLVEQAFQLFYKRFREEINEEDELIASKHKTCESAAVALAAYPERFYSEDIEVAFTEVAGSVYITDTDKIHYRLDLIGKNEYGKHFVRDHKTTSRFDSTFTEQWTLSFQIGTYSHVLMSLYPPNDIYGVEINGIKLGHTIKKGIEVDFMRVPVRKTGDMMQVWWWHAKEYLKQIHQEFDNLSYCKEGDEVLEAFPQNPQACTKYGIVCPYHDFCSFWPNPLQRAEEVPLGFEMFRWNPMTHARDAKKILNIEKELDYEPA